MAPSSNRRYGRDTTKVSQSGVRTSLMLNFGVRCDLAIKLGCTPESVFWPYAGHTRSVVLLRVFWLSRPTQHPPEDLISKLWERTYKLSVHLSPRHYWLWLVQLYVYCAHPIHVRRFRNALCNQENRLISRLYQTWYVVNVSKFVVDTAYRIIERLQSFSSTRSLLESGV